MILFEEADNTAIAPTAILSIHSPGFGSGDGVLCGYGDTEGDGSGRGLGYSNYYGNGNNGFGCGYYGCGNSNGGGKGGYDAA